MGYGVKKTAPENEHFDVWIGRVCEVTLSDRCVQQLTERRLVLMAAEAAKLAEEPEVAGRIKQARNRILEQSLISREVNAASTEEALRARYEAEKGKLDGAADEVRASHILVETKEEADAIIAQLYKGGDFAKLATEKSKGPSGAKGGDLGYFTKDKMVPEFANAAFDLPERRGAPNRGARRLALTTRAG